MIKHKSLIEAVVSKNDTAIIQCVKSSQKKEIASDLKSVLQSAIIRCIKSPQN